MNKTLQRIRKVIVDHYQPDKIILFGSRVWGKPHRWSDYDLFVLKKGEKRSPLRRGVEVKKQIRKKDIWAPLDIIIYNQKELDDILSTGSQLFHDILKRGKSVYEK